MALIALGANLNSTFGVPEATICAAAARIGGQTGAEPRLSRLWRTPAFPPSSGPDYVNAALAVETRLPAAALLAQLHALEAEAGRERVRRWGARTLDLDLLALGQEVAPDAATWRHWFDLSADEQGRLAPPELILPHPRMAGRGFVLVPLAEVAPDWRHPLLGKSVAEMLTELSSESLAGITPL